METVPRFENLHEFVNVADEHDGDVVAGNFCPLCYRRCGIDGMYIWIQSEYNQKGVRVNIEVCGCVICYSSGMTVDEIMDRTRHISSDKTERMWFVTKILMDVMNNTLPIHVLKCIVAYDAGIPNGGDFLN